jgi:hypothetical protein
MTAPHAVSPPDIEAELTRVWDALEGTNKMRASLFNLIIYTQNNPRAAYIRSIVGKVIEKFPSRILFVTFDKTSPQDYLKTTVSVLTASKGEHDIACDLIEIEVSNSQQARVPFLILPHLLPDLPVYLMWAEDPTQENPLSYQLERFASRLIVDSEATDNLPRFAKALLLHRAQSQCDIADLNWARLGNWRELLSSAFYTQDKLNDLRDAQSIQIIYNSTETPFFCHTKTQAIYLQGWLASQLGWRLTGSSLRDQTLVFSYQGNKEVSIVLEPASRPTLSPGTILSMDLRTHSDHHFSFSRDAELPQQVSIQFSTPTVCALPAQFVFAKSGLGQALVKEICHRGTSAHYARVLELMVSMEGMNVC